MSWSYFTIFFFLIIPFAPETWGEYVRVGPLIGQDCYGVGVEVCPEYELVAQKKGDQLYSIAEVIPDGGVDGYSKVKGLCWKTLRSEGGGLLSRAINMVILETYIYIDEYGKQKEVKPDKLRFACYKR